MSNSLRRVRWLRTHSAALADDTIAVISGTVCRSAGQKMGTPSVARAIRHRFFGKSLSALAFGAVGALLFASPVVAFAETIDQIAEQESDASGLALLIPNALEFIPMLVGFLILWALLAKFGWPAITGMLDQRVSTVKESLEQAENARLEGERLLAEHKAQLEEAKQQSAQIIADAKAAAEVLRGDITAKAQEEAQAMLARASAAIEVEKKAAIAELQSSVADLSVAVAGRVIGTDLSDSEHRAIIERYLVEAGSFDAN